MKFRITCLAVIGSLPFAANCSPPPDASPTGSTEERATTCVAITSPARGAVIAGAAVAVKTTDTCAGAWFESLLVDGAHVGDFPVGTVVLDASKLAAGAHTLEVRSQSKNPNSAVLGSASVSVDVEPACVAITAPASGATVSGSVAVHTNDTCAGVWFESLFVDGAHVGDFPAGTGVLDTTKLADGAHSVKVTSQSMNPSSKVLGAASIAITVSNAPPSNAQDAVTLPPGAALPTEAECAAFVAQRGHDAEHAPWNAGASDGFNYNKPPPGGTPSYFYAYAGKGSFSPNSQIARVDGNQSGTTDDLVRIFSCKYGIAANITRSQMVNESNWHEDCPALAIPGIKSAGGSGCHSGGDLNVPPGDPSGLPVTAITPGGVFSGFNGAGGLSGTNHYDSWGIEQDKVYYSWMYWPMIAVSTSWALDVRAAELRSCIDGEQAGYFTNNGSNVKDYQASVANAKASPNGAIQSGMACLQVNFNGQPKTNINCVTIGCFGSHLSGGWFATSNELTYDSNGFANITNRTWPGQETN